MTKLALLARYILLSLGILILVNLTGCAFLFGGGGGGGGPTVSVASPSDNGDITAADFDHDSIADSIDPDIDNDDWLNADDPNDKDADFSLTFPSISKGNHLNLPISLDIWL